MDQMQLSDVYLRKSFRYMAYIMPYNVNELIKTLRIHVHPGFPIVAQMSEERYSSRRQWHPLKM